MNVSYFEKRMVHHSDENDPSFLESLEGKIISSPQWARNWGFDMKLKAKAIRLKKGSNSDYAEILNNHSGGQKSIIIRHQYPLPIFLGDRIRIYGGGYTEPYKRFVPHIIEVLENNGNVKARYYADFGALLK